MKDVQGAKTDTLETHAAALEYIDRQLGKLWDALQKRASTFCILTSDHGTTYGEYGYTGHRISHPVVWTVPYGEFVLEHIGLRDESPSRQSPSP